MFILDTIKFIGYCKINHIQSRRYSAPSEDIAAFKNVCISGIESRVKIAHSIFIQLEPGHLLSGLGEFIAALNEHSILATRATILSTVKRTVVFYLLLDHILSTKFYQHLLSSNISISLPTFYIKLLMLIGPAVRITGKLGLDDDRSIMYGSTLPRYTIFEIINCWKSVEPSEFANTLSSCGLTLYGSEIRKLKDEITNSLNTLHDSDGSLLISETLDVLSVMQSCVRNLKFVDN